MNEVIIDAFWRYTQLDFVGFADNIDTPETEVYIGGPVGLTKATILAPKNLPAWSKGVCSAISELGVVQTNRSHWDAYSTYLFTNSAAVGTEIFKRRVMLTGALSPATESRRCSERLSKTFRSFLPIIGTEIPQ